MSPSVPSPAATVILLRDSPDGLLVFMVRRGEGAPFMPGAHVFPGGKVEEADRSPAARESWSVGLDAASRIFREKVSSLDGAAFLIAAARELEEEVGVRLPEVEAMRPIAHWVTPEIEPRRFDTWFLVASCPDGVEPVVDSVEVGEGEWVAVDDVPRRMRLSLLHLPPPTLHTLLDLTAFPDRAELFADLGQRPLPTIEPLVSSVKGRLAIVLPGDELHPSPGPVRGPLRMIMDGERYWSVARVEG